ncbi:MAG: histidine--tRNA ligase [Desulfobacterales bacterium]
MKVKALNGFKDILPDDVLIWRRVEETARKVLERFHFAEIRLPVLEKTELFARSIGSDTDIVEKEMYTFVDKQITMRPEATASLMRAYIEHNMHGLRPVQRLFTIGPMFRHERPQKGRLRQFHQLDVEVLGSASPRLDAELMSLGESLFSELGVSTSLEINSLGCPDCRPGYRQILLSFINERIDQLCEDCRRRSVNNPLRVLDCKKPGCRKQVEDAPSVIEHLCENCSTHFTEVRKNLDLLGVEYLVNKFMVRGLDYYVRTTFEFITDQLGAQSAVCAGGRYDGLIEMLGGPKVPGIGFAMGIERLVLLLKQRDGLEEKMEELDLFIAGLGDEASDFSFKLMHELRERGYRADMDLDSKSLKSQMKQADKAGARFVVIIGSQELENKQAPLRNMKTGEQTDLQLAAIGDFLANAVD